MARIIPWNMPSVAGGSIGGYTPAGDDSDPVITGDYFDFSIAQIYASGVYNVCWIKTAEAVTAGTTADVKLADPAAAPSYRSNDIFALRTLDVTGVSMVSVTVEAQSRTGYADMETDNLVFLVNYESSSLQFISGSADVTVATDRAAGLESYCDITKYTWNVYNSAGQVIQTYERVVE